ncbi:UPF0481 protein At3g47200-like isoform X2 [Dioscorea cayenensis subsp. rotundata]|uniref:UPF0481 protein At3g47200-like isoform X2 n=1 Tax=Dioscorea cayennensis subsp. rotundata TaxID=55577 RepID=A0AB40AU31_DIOCR|nr:UPF0481 protein At3g47200-like isoform X2 [Dioscorea cayenensis subsp. rotundata]
MTTSTRDSHEIIIQPELNRCEKNIGESMTTSYAEEGERTMTEENKEEPWKAFIEEETKKLNLKYYQEQTVTMSIFQLPAYATSITPRSVSFGPFHHGEQNLKFAEYWKQMAVLKFISRTNQSLEHLIGEMRKAMDELQANYALLEDKWRNDIEFVKLMIWDGCFMLELLRNDPSTSFIYNPHFGAHGGQGRLPPRVWDVLLLDNQLPLLVIKVLLQIEAESTEKPPLADKEINNLVFKLLGMKDMHDATPTLGLHILDLCRKGMIGPLIGNNTASSSPESSQIMFSAVKLHESGVRFEKSPTNRIRDISFDKDKGILMLPSLNIDEATEPTFLSLMLFELLHLMPQGDLLRQLQELADTFPHKFEKLSQLFEQVTRQRDKQFQSKLNIPDEILSQVQSKLNIPDLIQRQLQSGFPEIQKEIMPYMLIGRMPTQLEIDIGVYKEVHSQINQLQEKINKDVFDQAFAQAFQQAFQTIPHLGKQILDEEFPKQVAKLSEKQAQGFDQEVVSYIFFMRDLIDSDRDVHFLKSKKIIFVDKESEQAVAQLLKSLTERFSHISTSEIAVIRRNVNEYSKRNVTRLFFRLNKVSTSLKRRVKRWLEILMNLYFDNPWSAMGVIGGVILLVLTCLQTYFSFLSYQHPKDKV